MALCILGRMMNESEWQSIIDEFAESLRAEKSLADLTIRNYKADLQPLYDYMRLRGIGDMRALDRVALRSYLAWLTELGYVRHSVSRKLSTLRSFLRWLARKGMIDGDPLPKRGVMRVEKRLPRFLSQEQAERLMDAPDANTAAGLRDIALLEVIYGAGLRVSEASNLRVSDLNLATREMRVVGKGSKERVALLGETAKTALLAYLSRARPQLAGKDSGMTLFLNRFGGRLSQRSIQEKVRRYGMKAALPAGIHTHTLRHSYATHMLEGGADLRVVQELMGHASPATTQIYTHVTNAQARRAYMSAHPRARRGRGGDGAGAAGADADVVSDAAAELDAVAASGSNAASALPQATD